MSTMYKFALVLSLSIPASFAAVAQNTPSPPARNVQSVTPPAPPAAPAPARAPAVTGEPERTTATFGDWVMRCERSGEGANARKICEIVQSVQVQGQQAPIAQIAIGRVQKSDPLRLTLVLPSNVTLTSPPKFSTEEKDGQLVDTIWQRCLPIGCLADVVLRDEITRAMRARNDQGRVEFRDGVGREIRLPFSLKGAAQALDALAKE
jgi:invasion protein IalB